MRELKALLSTHTWIKCPSVVRENAYFYYRRDSNYIAHRVILDHSSGRWFYHITVN